MIERKDKQRIECTECGYTYEIPCNTLDVDCNIQRCPKCGGRIHKQKQGVIVKGG